MVLIDGKATARIDPSDRGFTYGDGVFRTMRSARGRVLHWVRHFEKLTHDCARLKISCPTQEQLADDLHQVVSLHPDGIAKIIVTRGMGGRGYAAPSVGRPTRIVCSFPLSDNAAKVDDGVRARWCSTQVSMQPALAGVKHLNRLDSVLARSEWTSPEIAEGLMLDRDGYVIEGTMSNVFILENDRLVTPVLDQAGVAGVQRDRLLEAARRVGLRKAEERITRERLLAADAVYLTNSVIGFWWVAALDERSWSRVSLTRTLQERIELPYDD